MAEFTVSRRSWTVTASGECGAHRSFVCRSLQSAVALETKLTNDSAFAAQWIRNTEPKSPEVKRHGLEREWVGRNLPFEVAPGVRTG